jgi:hypothetical protein
MLDDTNYSYKDAPFTKTKIWGVHPLSNKGHQEYISKDSQVHWYMHKVPPKLLKEIYPENQKPLTHNTNNIQAHIMIPQENNEKEQFENANKCEDNTNNVKEALDSKSTLTNPISSSSLSTKTPYKHKSPVVKSKLTPYKIPEINSRYIHNYDNEIDNFKTRSNKFLTSPTLSQSKFTSFKSYEVPRVDQVNRNEFSSTKRFTKNINNTVYSPVRGRSEICLQKENERLNEVFMHQTNKDFLVTNKLPSIDNILNQAKSNYNKTNTSNTKMMGSKYNPDNYTGQSKNWSKRNYLGALYPH